MDVLNTKIKNILQEKNTKIRPENIKNGVNILGINGNYTGSGGKNMQVQLGMYVKTKTAYGSSGLSLTVAKTGTYTIKWLCQRMSTSGTSGSAIYINGTQYGSNYETWGLTYYKDNVVNETQAAEYVLNEVSNVSLSQNDVVEIYGRSNSNGTWEYNYALVIEEE